MTNDPSRSTVEPGKEGYLGILGNAPLEGVEGELSEKDILVGHLVAIEYMLAQLYARSIKEEENLQDWINDDIIDITLKLDRLDRMTETQKQIAIASVQRVLQTVSELVKVDGQEPSLAVMLEPSPRDEG